MLVRAKSGVNLHLYAFFLCRENARIFLHAHRVSSAAMSKSTFPFEFELSNAGDPAQRALIAAPLRAFNMRAIGSNHFEPLSIVLRDAHGQVVGGLWGHTACGWLYTELLVVPEASRGSGIGAALMDRAEREAIARGCHSAWLDTHGFQAKGFYEKLGHAEFGRLDDFPMGHARHFFRKQLPGAA